jgi:hypothetical protein
MNLGQQEVPEREAHTIRQLGLDVLDRPVRLTRERALVIAILDDERRVRRPANVIDAVV